MISTIVPSRITEAREARAKSMEELATSIGVTRQCVSKYERGIVNPSPNILKKISDALNFQIEFFYKKELGVFAFHSPLFFRSNSNILKKVKIACKYQIKWTDEIKKQLEKYVDFVAVDLPIIDKNYDELSSEDIENFALYVRNIWGINDSPVIDLIGLLENKGILVSKISANELCQFKGIDAFSNWTDKTPYILYNDSKKSAVRIRFSILHELGHLLMHSSITEEESTNKEIIDKIDEQADRFAAAFLLPATSFPNDLFNHSLDTLVMIKKKWGASISAIINRCASLGLLRDNQINYLKSRMTVLKYWHHEPLDDVLTIAGPEMLRDAVYLLIDNKIITKQMFINLCGLSTNDLQDLCGLPKEFFESLSEREKPMLKLIK